MDACALRGKGASKGEGNGEIPSVVHGFPIWKLYPSLVGLFAVDLPLT